jgi:hypothetical protein
VQGYDVLEDMMSPRTSASNFVTTIATKRAKNHLPPLMQRVVEVMNTYAAAGAASSCDDSGTNNPLHTLSGKSVITWPCKAVAAYWI